MNKIKILSAFLCALLMGFTSCANDTEESTNDYQPNVSAARELTVGMADNATNSKSKSTTSRSIVNPTLGNMWQYGDAFLAYNLTDGGEHSMLTAENAGIQTKIRGKVTCKQGDDIAMFFPYMNASTVTEVTGDKSKLSLELSGQTGDLTETVDNYNTITNYDFSWGKIENVKAVGSKASGNVQMQKRYAVLHLKFECEGQQVKNITSVKLTNIAGKAVMNLQTGELENTTDKAGFTVTPKTAVNELNVIVFAQSNFNPTFSVETNSGKTYGVKITHNLNIINGGYYDLNVLVDDTTPWIDIHGIKWGRYNLQYDPSVTEEGWVSGYSLTKNPWDYFYTEPSGLAGQGFTMSTDFENAKFDHFRWGDIAAAHNYGYSGREKFYTGTGNIQAQNISNNQYGDLPYYVSKGKWKLPTKAEFDDLMAHSGQYLGYYYDGLNTVYGVLFDPTVAESLKGKVLDKNDNVLKTSNANASAVSVGKINISGNKLKQFTISDMKRGIFFPFAGTYTDYSAGNPVLNKPGSAGSYWTANGTNADQAQSFTGQYLNNGQFYPCTTVGVSAQNPKRNMYSIRPIYAK